MVEGVTYREQIALAFSLTWRLLASNIVLLLIVAMLTIAFGSPRNATTGVLFFALFFALECLVAWPFVVRRTLPPQVFALDPRSFSLRYWPSVLFGLVADVLSVVPVLAIVLFVRLIGTEMHGDGMLAAAVVTVRLLVVLPAMLAFIARRPVAS